MKYRNVGNHAEDLADGRMVAPGEYTPDLADEDLSDPRLTDLIDRGVFIALDEAQATDAARKLADDKGVQINAVTGTGKDGQVTERDVEKFVRDSEREGS